MVYRLPREDIEWPIRNKKPFIRNEGRLMLYFSPDDLPQKFRDLLSEDRPVPSDYAFHRRLLTSWIGSWIYFFGAILIAFLALGCLIAGVMGGGVILIVIGVFLGVASLGGVFLNSKGIVRSAREFVLMKSGRWRVGLYLAQDHLFLYDGYYGHIIPYQFIKGFRSRRRVSIGDGTDSREHEVLIHTTDRSTHDFLLCDDGIDTDEEYYEVKLIRNQLEKWREAQKRSS